MQGHANIRTFAQPDRLATRAREPMLTFHMQRTLKGTTLLEMLAAIALLATITAVAMPGALTMCPGLHPKADSASG